MKVISNIKRFFKYWVLVTKLHRASRKADKLQQATGITHFVVKGRKSGLLVLTRKQYRDRCAKGDARPVTSEQMYQGCFYCTRWYNKNTPTPQEVIDRKRRIYLASQGL